MVFTRGQGVGNGKMLVKGYNLAARHYISHGALSHSIETYYIQENQCDIRYIKKWRKGRKGERKEKGRR